MRGSILEVIFVKILVHTPVINTTMFSNYSIYPFSKYMTLV